jgi:glycosyltransferase involved in cell wall biosynthesis
MRPVRRSWGGGNQWVQQTVTHLRRRNIAVCYSLEKDCDCIVMVEPRIIPTVRFAADEIRRYKATHPQTLCIHRINECDQRKGTNFMDALLAQANDVADYTIFISQWLRDYHAERWFDLSRPHTVIYNGADPAVFHPIDGSGPQVGIPFRLVTHHWSDNWKKGFALYKTIDNLIAEGVLTGFELWVIGRWPWEILWRSAVTFPPTTGIPLARMLRQCHAYITASVWEPGGMHHVEGAQCGLPVLYHRDGGGIVEAARQYGIAFTDDTVVEAVNDMRNSYSRYRDAVLAQAPCGDRMCWGYLHIIVTLCARKGIIYNNAKSC